MADLDISDVMTGVTQANNVLNDSISTLMGIQSDATAAGKQEQAGIASSAAGQVGVSTANEKANIKQKLDTENFMAEIGSNPDAKSYVLGSLGQSILAKEGTIQNLKNVVEQKSQISFLDDPLNWIAAQVSLPFDQRALGIATDDRDDTISAITKLSAASTTQAAALAVMDTGAGTERLDALNIKTLGEAAVAAAQSKIRLAQLGIQGLSLNTQLTEDQFDNRFKLFSANYQVQNLAIEQGKLQVEQAMLPFQQRYYSAVADFRDEQVKAAEGNEEAKKALTTKLSVGLPQLNMAPMSYNEWEHSQPQFRAKVEQMLTQTDIMNGHYGYNTAASVENVEGLGINLNPGENLLYQQLSEIRNRVVSETEGGTYKTIDGKTAPPVAWKSLTPTEQNSRFQMAVQSRMKSDFSLIPKSGSVYSPPPLRTLVANPNVINMPLAKELAPLAANQTQDADPTLVMTTAANMISQGKMSAGDASEQIAKMYQTGMQLNAQAYQYSKWQLGAPTADTGYNMTVNYGGGIGAFGRFSRPVNMANSADIQNALTRMLIAQKTENIILQGMTGAPGAADQGVK